MTWLVTASLYERSTYGRHSQLFLPVWWAVAYIALTGVPLIFNFSVVVRFVSMRCHSQHEFLIWRTSNSAVVSVMSMLATVKPSALALLTSRVGGLKAFSAPPPTTAPSPLVVLSVSISHRSAASACRRAARGHAVSRTAKAGGQCLATYTSTSTVAMRYHILNGASRKRCACSVAAAPVLSDVPS